MRGRQVSRAREATRPYDRRVQRNVAIGSASATIAFCAVGSSFAAAERLITYPVAGGQAVRYAVAALLLLGFLGGRLPRVGRSELAQLTLLAAVGLAAFNLLMVAAVAEADPASVGAIVGCVPAVLAIGGPLLGRRRIDPRLLGAACVVAVGVAVVQGAGGGMSVSAVLLSLGALLCEAAFTLLAAPLLPRLGAAGVSTWAVLIAAALLSVYALLVDGPAHAIAIPTGAEALALAYMAAVVTAVAFVLCYSAVHRLGVERTGLFAGLVPVSALFAAAALGDSELTVVRMLGAFAVAGGLVVGLRLSRPPPLPVRP
jgi:drug/metabolite transporter (DMT)-like permease